MIRRVKSYEDILALFNSKTSDGWLTGHSSGWMFAPDMIQYCGKEINVEDKAHEKGVRKGTQYPNTWWWAEEWLEPLNSNTMDFSIDKEAILKAAATSPQAKAALEALCPEAFITPADIRDGEIKDERGFTICSKAFGTLKGHIRLNTTMFKFELITSGIDQFLKVTNR